LDNSLSRALGSRALITHTHASRPARTLDDDGDVPGRRTAVHGRGAKAECPAGPCRWFRPAAPGAGAAAACCTYTVACHHRCCRSPPSPSVTAAAAAPVGGEPEPRDGLRATQFNVIARREAIAHRGKRRAPYEKKKKNRAQTIWQSGPLPWLGIQYLYRCARQTVGMPPSPSWGVPVYHPQAVASRLLPQVIPQILPTAKPKGSK